MNLYTWNAERASVIFAVSSTRFFSKIVPPLVERAIENLNTKEKFDYLNKEGDYDEVMEKLDKIDLEARKLVYQYLKLALICP